MKFQKIIFFAAFSLLFWLLVVTPVLADDEQVCIQECVDTGMSCQDACADDQCVETCQDTGAQCTESC